MAVSPLLSHEVSDLCIGKPPLRPLPVSATVGEALLNVRECDGAYLSVWSASSRPEGRPACVGKVGVVDVICYLCSEENAADPSSALGSPVSALLDKGAAGLVRLVDPRASIVEALDEIILHGAQNLLVPIRRRKESPYHREQYQYCCLTQEDFVRFFFDSIGHFSPTATLSISALGLVRPATLAVPYDHDALSAVPLIKQALASQTAVAVVADDGKLVGEISPSALALLNVAAVAAAVCVLSAGELMAYIDLSIPPEDVASAVRARIEGKGLNGMLHLLEIGDDELSSLGSSSASSSSSSSDEETAPERKSGGSARGRRCSGSSGSFTARMSWRSEGAIVCHPGSSLVAVMMQALAHRVSYVWVIEEDYTLAGVVTFSDILVVFREQLRSRC